MLPLLLFVLLTLVQTGISPAVGTTAMPRPTSIPPSVLTPTLADHSSDVCRDVEHYRTLLNIIWSCLGTLFACIWVAVHRNIPGPRQSWISIQVESLKVVVSTLFVPEWVLAWAVRQFLTARKYGIELEKARVDAQRARQASRQSPGVSAPENGRSTTSVGEGTDSHNGVIEGVHTDDGKGLIALSAVAPESDRNIHGEGEMAESHHGLLEKCRDDETRHPPTSDTGIIEPKTVDLDTWKMEAQLGRTNESWTTAHGFFVIMGGFHYYANGEPRHPLHYREVLRLIESRSLVPPTSIELGDKSKGDTLSKTIAVCQTLWFVLQCVARRIENIAITNLEIMTLAYTVMTLAMYAAWWHKPVHLSRLDRVPTFWSSTWSDQNNNALLADVFVLVTATIFGAIHCAAWFYVFPSQTEMLMWRASAVAIAGIPVVPLLVAVAILHPFVAVRTQKWRGYFLIFVLAAAILVYINARIALLILSFTTLRSLPLTAYQTVHWTSLIPHI